MSDTLILNRHFMAVQIAPWEKAMSLLYRGHAAVVDEDYRRYDFDEWKELSQEIENHPAGYVNSVSFKIAIPYFSLANSLKIFEKNSRKELLSADLSGFLSCNGNGICEVEKGETAQNCIGDCGKEFNTYSEQTKKLFEQNNGTIIDPVTKEIVLQDLSFSNNKSSATPASKNNPRSPLSPEKNSLYLLIFGIIAAFVIAFSMIFIFLKKIKKSN